MKRIIIGIMGPGEGATARDCEMASELGRFIAQRGWTLLTGGRNTGVMDAASKGAKEAGGLTVGVLPSGELKNVSEAVDIPILTGMGEARNAINVLSSQVILVCGMNVGTASEVALGLKSNRPVVLVDATETTVKFFTSFGHPIHNARDTIDAMRIVDEILQRG